MPRVDFKIVGAYNKSRSQEFDNQDTVNLYIDYDKEEIHKLSLNPLPGIEELFTIDDVSSEIARDNGFYKYRDNLYCIFGSKVFRVDNNNNILSIGSLNSTEGYISWANSNTQIAIADGSKLYVITVESAAFTDVTSIQTADFPSNPFVCYYQDARLFIRFRDDPRVYYSALGDFTNFNRLNEVPQQSRPSLARSLVGVNERLFFLADVSTEVWQPPTYPTTTPIFRDNNLIYEFGCAATGSVVKGLVEKQEGHQITSFVAWLATNENGLGVFVMSNGGAPVKISSRPIARLMESFPRVDDCIGTVYKEDDAIFIEYTFPAANKTLVYEVITGTWTRKEDAVGDRSLIVAHAFVNGKHLVGTRKDNKVYRLRRDLFTENGLPVRRSRTTYTFEDINGRRIQGKEFRVIAETGFVLSNFDGKELCPVMKMSYSIDGGATFSTPTDAPFGKIGDFRRQAIWMTLGMGYKYTFKIETYDPIPVFILSASFDYEIHRE